MKIKPYTSAPFLAVLVYLLTLCANQLIAKLDMNANAFLLTSGAIQFVTYLLPVVLYGLLFGGISPKRMRLKLPVTSSVPVQILLAVILLLGSALISMVSIRIGIVPPSENTYSGIGAPNILVLLVFAIVPAVCEEFVFRGIIMSSFEMCGVFPAVIGTSLLFAFAHMSLENLPLYFFSSVILCLVTYVSRSLLSAIVLHSLYNVAAIALGGYISGIAAHLESFSLLFIIMLFLLWIFVIVALTEGSRVYRIYSEKNFDSSYAPTKLSRAGRLKASAAVYFSLPFLLSVLIFIAVVVFGMKNIT